MKTFEPSIQRGFTLIEFAVTFAVMSILIAMGVPAFQNWIQNAQVRTGAESVLNGLQLARAEAVRRNTQVLFSLTDTSGAVAWTVGCVNVVTDTCPQIIQSHDAAEGGGKARVGVDTTNAVPNPVPAGYFDTAIPAGTGLAASATFDGMGRLYTRNMGFSPYVPIPNIQRIDVTHASGSNARRMVIYVSAVGQVRMCDPALSGNPQGCVQQ